MHKKYQTGERGSKVVQTATNKYLKTHSGRASDTLKKFRTKLQRKGKLAEKSEKKMFDMFGEEPNIDDIISDEDSTIAIDNLDKLGNRAVLTKIRSYKVRL